MVMLEELYNVISDSYKAMNREFDIPLSSITEETQLKDLDMDSVSFVVIMMNIEEKMNVRLNVSGANAFQTVGDVIKAIEEARK
jgi:acyl carrier protein